MMRFSNKFELRYTFNDKSNYIEAMTRHRCEKEVLALMRSIADLIDVKMTIYDEPCDKVGGFRQKWGVAGENSRSISIVLNMAMRILTTPSLSVGGQLLFDRTDDDELETQRELAKLRHELRMKVPGAMPSHRLMELLNAMPRFYKCKSNFYDSLRGCLKVKKISLRELNEYDRSRSGSLEVKREQFDYYILRSDDLPTVTDNRATIEIISPVLSDSKYRWKGIYHKYGQTIDFYMQDDEFKLQMLEDKLSFTSGMCIDCVLEISRRLSELGDVINVGYVVTTVIRMRIDKKEMVTPQGKRHIRKMDAEKRQLTLDLFG